MVLAVRHEAMVNCRVPGPGIAPPGEAIPEDFKPITLAQAAQSDGLAYATLKAQVYHRRLKAVKIGRY